jgi:hypothetical protein
VKKERVRDRDREIEREIKRKREKERERKKKNQLLIRMCQSIRLQYLHTPDNAWNNERYCG